MGWQQFGESCYYFNSLETDKASWMDAFLQCDDISTSLVIIESEEEDNFIKEYVGDHDNLWIGLHSMYSIHHAGILYSPFVYITI